MRTASQKKKKKGKRRRKRAQDNLDDLRGIYPKSISELHAPTPNFRSHVYPHGFPSHPSLSPCGRVENELILKKRQKRGIFSPTDRICQSVAKSMQGAPNQCMNPRTSHTQTHSSQPQEAAHPSLPNRHQSTPVTNSVWASIFPNCLGPFCGSPPSVHTRQVMS